MGLPPLEVEDFQSSSSDSDSVSGDDTTESCGLSTNSTDEDTRFSGSFVGNLSTQSSENEAASSDEEPDSIHILTPQNNMPFLKPYRKPPPEAVSNLFSFPTPQWIRQRSTKIRSISRSTSNLDEMSVDFDALHVTGNGTTSHKTSVTVTAPEINSSGLRRDPSNHSFLRKVAPLPRRHAPQNTVAVKQCSTDGLKIESHPRSVSSSSAGSSQSSEDGMLTDYSSTPLPKILLEAEM
ncbi:hypothetical protein Clacol_003938 [Clathrus columnatus]|uniref:Uncharacterized protein n=1 Tax=Clathrus columnatus TaxID=1419009 RepID=A0AAV5AAI4_9AGAM|nr:hypothetical protein Clacol_003938 [Clathrus columnatus]